MERWWPVKHAVIDLWFRQSSKGFHSKIFATNPPFPLSESGASWSLRLRTRVWTMNTNVMFMCNPDNNTPFGNINVSLHIHQTSKSSSWMIIMSTVRANTRSRPYVFLNIYKFINLILYSKIIQNIKIGFISKIYLSNHFEIQRFITACLTGHQRSIDARST